VSARFEQLTHGKVWQSHCSVSFTGWPDARVIPLWRTPDGDTGTPCESHPRMRDGGLIGGDPGPRNRFVGKSGSPAKGLSNSCALALQTGIFKIYLESSKSLLE
jgi:hypothetical protein